ncbi:hemagglutinin repeat-containing protein, partial [Commensalibacter melissae]|uniref:hemagglutinin repeat-containing protein n=1 Tax=Commensalibacter melissae TaxID=2070537 RepID=UPI0012D95866
SVNAVKDIKATASSISGNDVIFNAGRDISLDAGYRTSRSKTTSSGNREDIGAHGFAFGASGDASVSWGKTTTYGKTAIDTVVNGTNSVTINNKIKL